MVPVVCFAGQSNSGKTTLIVNVVRELKRRGYRVGVIKHAPHGFEADRIGKDSWRLSEAGSDSMALISPGETMVMTRLDGDLQAVINQFSSRVDIILIEGYKGLNLPKVLVSREKNVQEIPRVGDNVLGIVSQEEYCGPLPHFGFSDIGGLVDFLVACTGSSKYDRNRAVCLPPEPLSRDVKKGDELALPRR